MNSAIEVLVIQSVFIVPDSGSWIGHLVTHKPDAIVTRVRLNLVYCGTGPSHDCRLHPKGGTNRRKCKSAGATADSKLAIGDVVVHVAFARI